MCVFGRAWFVFVVCLLCVLVVVVCSCMCLRCVWSVVVCDCVVFVVNRCVCVFLFESVCLWFVWFAVCLFGFIVCLLCVCSSLFFVWFVSVS